MARRYAIRLMADDDCWIPVTGFKVWRWYWGALLAARRMRPGFRDPLVVWDNELDEAVAIVW